MRSSPALLLSALQTVSTVSGTVHHGYDYSGLRKISSFRWERPFPYDDTAPLDMMSKCEVEKSFKAEQWKLKDLQAPSPWAPAIETFLGWQPYVGSWEGADPDADEREFLIMEWTDVPVPVREWIETERVHKDNLNSRWWLFGLFEKPGTGNIQAVWPSVAVGEQQPVRDEDKVVLFAPAAMYEILPLWVGQGSECEADMLDLTKYSSYAKDHSVIAWPIKHEIPDTKHGKKDITFSIKAFYVVDTDDGKAWREMWNKHHTSLRRLERKLKREERRQNKAQLNQIDVDSGIHVRDEL